MKSDAVIARRLASQSWGPVQRQLKVADGIWSYANTGHGGFVVDTSKYPELSEYNTIVNINAHSNQYYPSEQHFAIFEEDCNYAIVIWLYPYVLDKMKVLYDIKDKSLDEWKLEMLGHVKKSLENWNKDILVKYPEHGKLNRG